MMRHEISGRTKKYCHAVVGEETWNLIRNDAPHKIEQEKQKQQKSLKKTLHTLINEKISNN